MCGAGRSSFNLRISKSKSFEVTNIFDCVHFCCLCVAIRSYKYTTASSPCCLYAPFFLEVSCLESDFLVFLGQMFIDEDVRTAQVLSGAQNPHFGFAIYDSSVLKRYCPVETSDKRVHIAVANCQAGGLYFLVVGMMQARIDRMEELEQMVIKTSAILGMSFSRRMLDTLLPKKITPNMMQDCMNVISDGGIFECASIASENQGANIGVLNHLGTPRYVCGCPGIGEDEGKERTINDCQMLYFKSATLQETAYEMYTESLRRKLHMKAARHLESQAHKCSSCGGGSFIPSNRAGPSGEVPPSSLPPLADIERIDGTSSSKPSMRTPVSKIRKQSLRIDTTSVANSKERTATSGRGRNAFVVGAVQSIDAAMSETGLREAKTRSKSLREKAAPLRSLLTRNSVGAAPLAAEDGAETEPRAVCSSLETIEASGGNDSTPLIDKVLRNKVDEQVDGGDGSGEGQNLDVRECRCMHILLSVYPQLVRHWKAAGNVEKTVHFLMEASAAAVAIDENLQALSYLKEIGHIFDCIKDGMNPFEGEVSHVESYVFDSWEEARMESLIGQALYHMGQLNEAIPHFHKTLKILGNTQPTSKFAVLMGILKEGFRQWQHHRFEARFLGKAKKHQRLWTVFSNWPELPEKPPTPMNASALLAHRLIEQSRCLFHVFHDYKSSGQHKRALLSVLQQVNKAEEVNSDLHELIIAYTCMMEYCQERHWPSLGGVYEYKAQIRSVMKKNMRAEDFISVAHLQCTSMNMRLAWGRIPQAVESGFTAYRTVKTIHDNDLLIQMLPVLAEALILSNRIKDAVEVLEDLEYIDNETDALVGKAWYYACCLDLILETGVMLESYEKCHHFAERYKDDHTFSSEKLAMFFLVCSLALWCQRKGRYDEVEKWVTVAKQMEPVSQYRSCMNVYSQLKLLEVELLELSRCKQRNKRDRILFLTPVILKEMKRLEKLCKYVPVCQARLMHLRAYYDAQWRQRGKAHGLLKRGLALCKKTGNEQERLWIVNNQKAWDSPRPEKKQENFWLSMVRSKTNVDWHAACENLVKFTLPLPSWFE